MKISFLQPLLLCTFLSCNMLDMDAPGNLVYPTVDEDSSLPSIEVNGTKLHAETFGIPTDPLIIILHGGPGGDYRDMLKFKVLADEGYYVIFYDQRGSGLSRRHSAEVYTLQTLLDDLYQVIAHYRLSPTQKVFFLGHSWGAMYATFYINNNLSEIDGAILSEPGGFTDEQTYEYLGKLFNLNLFADWLNDATWEDQFITSDDHIRLDYRMQTTVASEPNTGASSSDPIPFWRLGAICSEATKKNNPNFDFTTNLSGYTKKVLFLYSEKNVSYGKSHAQELSSAYPNVQLEMVQGVGHDMEYTGFDSYISFVRTYLAEVNN